MNEENYAHQGIFATCYCNPSYKPVAQSNKMASVRDLVLDKGFLEKGVDSKISVTPATTTATITAKRNFGDHPNFLEGKIKILDLSNSQYRRKISVTISAKTKSLKFIFNK